MIVFSLGCIVLLLNLLLLLLSQLLNLLFLSRIRLLARLSPKQRSQPRLIRLFPKLQRILLILHFILYPLCLGFAILRKELLAEFLEVLFILLLPLLILKRLSLFFVYIEYALLHDIPRKC